MRETEADKVKPLIVFTPEEAARKAQIAAILEHTWAVEGKPATLAEGFNQAIMINRALDAAQKGNGA